VPTVDILPAVGKKRPAPGGQKVAKEVRVQVGSGQGIPVEYATSLSVIYTGAEFLVSVIRVDMDPSLANRSSGDFPDEMEGKVVARFAFAPTHWQRTVGSILDQLEKNGLDTPRPAPPGGPT
jgi:hypothetical protein